MAELALEDRIRRVEDRAAIQDLVVLYGFVMDERDVPGIHRLFAHDATLRSQDGVFAATGIDEIVKTYEGRFAALGPTNHVSHGHVVRFDDADPDRATGLVAGHAEVVAQRVRQSRGVRAHLGIGRLPRSLTGPGDHPRRAVHGAAVLQQT
jgi:hypothetical protein